MEQEWTLYIRMAEAVREQTFLQKLSMTQSDVDRHFGGVIWNRLLSPLMPMEARLSCSQALEAFRPLLAELAPTPAEGWRPTSTGNSCAAFRGNTSLSCCGWAGR